MKGKDVLYFEEDDKSELGVNGKKVFFAKRINGKTERNKGKEKENEEEKLKDNEIIIDLPYIPKNNNKDPKKRTSNTPKNKKSKSSKETPKKQTEKSKEKKQKKKSNKNNITKQQKGKRNKKESKEQNKRTNKTKTKQKKEINNKKIQENKNKKNSEGTRYKKRKKKRKTLKIFISLMLLIIALIIFALVSPIFNIQEITVYGNETVSTETIISLSNLQAGKNIFQNIKSDIISKIKENTYIDDVTIKRILPGTIEITVEEREVAYQVNVINGYVYLDYQGYILETSSEKKDVPILSGLATSEDTLLNGQRLENEDISKLNAILKIVDNAKQLEIYDLITEIIIEENEYILYLKSEKKYIYLGDSSNITNKMMYAEIIIEKEKGNEGYAMINGDLDDGFDPYFREESID